MVNGFHSGLRQSFSVWTIVIIFLACCLLSGCSSEDIAKKNINAPLSTATTNPTPNVTRDPTHTPEPAKVVINIVDALGQEISFESTPKKIATISPTATEMLYLLGGSSILRDRSSDFPNQVKAVPSIGSAYNPSIEKIVAGKPDLVILEALTQARFVGVLKNYGLQVMAVKAETLDDIKTSILNIGSAIDKKDVASAKILDIEKRLLTVGSNDGRSVLLLISDQDRNLYAARPESYTGLIADILGMENKAAGLADSGPYPGFAAISPEAILKSNPDIIITISPAPAPAPRLSKTLVQIPPFAGLKAIRTDKVIEADVALFLQSPGPRIINAVEFLKKRLTPESS